MSPLSHAVDDYISVRRALGYQLAENARLLPDFVAYLEAAGTCTVTSELAVGWATQPTGSTPVWWARRLAMVRGLPHRCRRVAPFLYSDADIAAVMAAARALRSLQRAATYETLIGLLAVTGMRIGEAIRLDRDHVDLDEGIVTIWNSKFRKSRAIPVHPDTVDALRRYARRRDRCCPHPRAPSFFLSTTGTRLHSSGIHDVFARLVQTAGVGHDSPRRPRPHDLRHTFATRTLLGWYRAGVNVDAHMPLLSTYLGHSDPENTYWYLSAVPELLFLASQRLERVEEARS
jgi:integrase